MVQWRTPRRLEVLKLRQTGPIMECMAKSTKGRTKDRHGPHRMLRVPADLYEALEEVAKANERPVTWEGLRAIRAHLNDERKRLGLPELQPPSE